MDTSLKEITYSEMPCINSYEMWVCLAVHLVSSLSSPNNWLRPGADLAFCQGGGLTIKKKKNREKKKDFFFFFFFKSKNRNTPPPP